MRHRFRVLYPDHAVAASPALAGAHDALAAVARQLDRHRGGQRDANVFTPLSPVLLAIHQRLKDEFDPARVFNPPRTLPAAR